MKLTVADPPYLGPAELWHGGKGRTRGPGTIPTGCTCGCGVLDAECPEPSFRCWGNSVPRGRSRGAAGASLRGERASRQLRAFGCRLAAGFHGSVMAPGEQTRRGSLLKLTQVDAISF